MGDSASGHIGFGFKLPRSDGAESDYPEAIQAILDGSVETMYTEKKGLFSPPYDNVCRGPAWDKWRADQKALWATANVTIEHGGYGQDSDQTERYLLVADSHVRLDWDEETVFSPDKMIEKPEWRAKLKEFCEFMELEYIEPQFMGFVYYG